MPTSPVLGFTYPTPLDPATADVWGSTLNTLLLAIDSEFGTRTVAQNYADFGLTRAEVKDLSEDANNLGNISGAVVIDYEDGHYQYGTLTGNITSITINNWPASGKAGWMTLELAQDGTGGRTLALGGAYKTPSGAGITLSTGANDVDTLHLFTRDSGSNIKIIANLNWS